jgi:3-dehydroquinate synthase
MKILLKITGTASSPVFTGNEVFSDLNEFLSGFCEGPSGVFILVDENTRYHCLPILLSNIPCLQYAGILEMPAGEKAKTPGTAQLLWEELLRRNAGRRSLLICLGGGVVTDMGGLVAATFHRGMSFIHIPTTLVGMVDAAIGGKSAINLRDAKNQVGLFVLPEAVFIYPGFLKTLDHGLVRSGIAEVAKMALVLDESLWKKMQAMDLGELLLRSYRDAAWEELIARPVKLKIRVVKKDFRESGYRSILNFGHTFGHAFESLFLTGDREPLSHGQAVAMGMICESYLSARLAGLEEPSLNGITGWILQNFDPFPVREGDFERLPEFLYRDKKRSGDRLNFTLIPAPGQAVIHQPVEQPAVKEAFLYFVRTLNGR